MTLEDYRATLTELIESLQTIIGMLYVIKLKIYDKQAEKEAEVSFKPHPKQGNTR